MHMMRLFGFCVFEVQSVVIATYLNTLLIDNVCAGLLRTLRASHRPAEERVAASIAFLHNNEN